MADFSGGPGFLAFVATFILVAGLVVLLRSLNKHLRNVRVNPPAVDAGEDQATTPGDATTTES